MLTLLSHLPDSMFIIMTLLWSRPCPGGGCSLVFVVVLDSRPECSGSVGGHRWPEVCQDHHQGDHRVANDATVSGCGQ